ncbi:MAG: hypothetical protein WCF33_15535 [Pseudonocardiaceae bacterium]
MTITPLDALVRGPNSSTGTLLLYGAGGSPELNFPFLNDLATAGGRVVAPYYPGTGTRRITGVEDGLHLGRHQHPRQLRRRIQRDLPPGLGFARLGCPNFPDNYYLGLDYGCGCTARRSPLAASVGSMGWGVRRARTLSSRSSAVGFGDVAE